MAVTVESPGINRLNVRERLELIEQIWDSLPGSVKPQEVPDWHLVELARRRAEAEPRPGEVRPWREALASFGGKKTGREAAQGGILSLGGVSTAQLPWPN